MSPRQHHHDLTMPAQRGGATLLIILLIIVLLAAAALVWYMMQLDQVVRSKFEGQRWEIPAKVYARPLELYAGAPVTPESLQAELKLLNYRESNSYQQSGTWTRQDNIWYVHTRGFDLGSRQDPEQVLKIEFAPSGIIQIQSTITSGTGMAHLEPVLIGGIYPRHNEDRVLVKLSDVPQSLIDALISTEDRQFYQHHGVSVRGTARALVSTITGKGRQGGSTLTQQLVKNFYLSSERTVKRKANEALMAILLEMHYSKNDILETYMNEINLGQNGNRSINGFGLAAQFYFDQPLRELKLHQLALLVGLANGPTQFNPWRHPKLSLERRNVVLKNMVTTGKLSQQDYESWSTKALDVIKSPTVGQSLFPDFLDVVRRQLAEQYQENDLSSEGLRIFSTLDPNVQTIATRSFENSIHALSKRNPKRLNGLQGAVVISNPQNGELLAVVGGDGLFTGFNRALDARRQIGSLIKPAIYLTALESGRYTLVSPLDDSPVSITGMGMKDWQPKNYDRQDHGTIPLYTALAQSYNQSTVRLGWDLGIPAVSSTLRKLSVEADIPQYPSLLLGAIDLTPFEVNRMYQVYAAGGFAYPLTSIREVVDANGNPLQRYGLSVKQQITPDASYLINYALSQVVKQGTAKALEGPFDPSLNLAGKTGTTNDARDAWFSGYSGNYVTTVWVGHDDNRPTGLSGSSGALPIWSAIMSKLKQTPVQFAQPTDVQWQWLDRDTGEISVQTCGNAVFVPLMSSHMPQDFTDCARDYYQQQQVDAYTDDSGTYLREPTNTIEPAAPDMDSNSTSQADSWWDRAF